MKTLQQKMGLTLALVSVLCLFLTPLAVQGAGREEIDRLTQRQEDLRRQKSGLEEQLDQLAQDENQAVARKGLLEQKIDVLSQQIQVSQQTIGELDGQIAQKQNELTKAQEEEAAYQDRYAQRVRAMEERGGLSYWSVLFQANSFGQLLDRVTMIGEIVAYDQEVMDRMAAARQAVAQAKAALEDSQRQQKDVLAQQQEQQTQLQAEQAKVEEVLAQIQSQSSRYGRDLAALEATEDQVAQDLSQAEAAYARQLEAQRQAELARQREAKRQAELEAQRQQQAAQQAAQQQNQGSSQGAPSASGLLWPVPSSHRVSSPFGYRNHPITHEYSFHRGIDIPAAYGSEVVASLSGVVVISRYHGSYGNYVVLSHGNGMRTLYAHLSSRLVSPGETVSRGETIGLIGSTGSSTGNHLHYETWTGSSSGSRVNPMNYF